MKSKLVILIFFACFFCAVMFVRGDRLSSKTKKVSFFQMTNNGPFLDFCKRAVNDPQVFSRFKRDPIYNLFHECGTFEEGKAALRILEKRNPELLHKDVLERIRRLDFYGNPKVYGFEHSGPFSPTTLLYLKVAGDLKKLIGPMDRLRVIEIGGGSGGLCKVLHEIFDIEHYTVIESSESAGLIRKHLLQLGLENVHFITFDQIKLDPYDLVISYDGFSGANNSLQKRYIEKLFPNASKGYLLCKFHPRQIFRGSLQKEDLLKRIQVKCRGVEVITEEPSTGMDDCIVMWGG